MKKITEALSDVHIGNVFYSKLIYIGKEQYQDFILLTYRIPVIVEEFYFLENCFEKMKTIHLEDNKEITLTFENLPYEYYVDYYENYLRKYLISKNIYIMDRNKKHINKICYLKSLKFKYSQ
jgi:hypothetical protein